jgi:hypothetical protein
MWYNVIKMKDKTNQREGARMKGKVSFEISYDGKHCFGCQFLSSYAIAPSVNVCKLFPSGGKGHTDLKLSKKDIFLVLRCKACLASTK